MTSRYTHRSLMMLCCAAPRRYPQDLEDTVGSWDMYGSDADKQRYNGLQSEFFTRATQPLSRRSSLLAFTAGGMCCDVLSRRRCYFVFNTTTAQPVLCRCSSGVAWPAASWSSPSPRARKYVVAHGCTVAHMHCVPHRTAARRGHVARSKCLRRVCLSNYN